MPFHNSNRPAVAPFGLVLSDPNKYNSVTGIILLSLIPVLCIALFALIRIWVLVPVYTWMYIFNVLSFVTPVLLYYAFLRNNSLSMICYCTLSLGLFVTYLLYLARVFTFVTACYVFSKECKVEGSKVVNAVANPIYNCSDYNVSDLTNFQYWAETTTTTYWTYGVLIGILIVADLAMGIWGILFAVRLRKGVLVTREAPTTFAYTVDTDGVTMTRGTHPDDGTVAVGIPVEKPAEKL
ncbi:hypothetical protein FOL47_003378 [Perkinsus chesapeaki]|uniref:Uncharacterized protein n=1 Tax=Perkinsus chesapeaki TaxID=330153 RepID=A0A7J6M8F3_PERCH|nr:hypothetical protein FOL47_003378 [Perkinsus chesapeaki]